MESFESLKNEFKLLDNFISRRNTSGVTKSMTKILENPARVFFSYKISANRSTIIKELKQNLSQLVSSYQNDQITIELINKCIILSKSVGSVIEIGNLTPVCILCHNPCDPYSKKIECCGYYAHIPCIEQIVNTDNKFLCPKCSKENKLVVEANCKNCLKPFLPENTMVSACRHIVCVDCVTCAQPLIPSPICFCCPYKLPYYSDFKIEDVRVF